ncbi:hypothetical protein WJX84_005620 [Apatococcus fuscideae]|uniref:Uncharacterized protein n=1 Tax=Apatococcus fuscideae TaxID=2026836 RepID=A0AAW1TE46_9CHLO
MRGGAGLHRQQSPTQSCKAARLVQAHSTAGRSPSLRAHSSLKPKCPLLKKPNSKHCLAKAAVRPVPVAQATVGSAQDGPEQESKPSWQGAKPGRLLGAILIGVAVKLIPAPSQLAGSPWNLLSIFVATIAGLVLEPLPTGAWAFLAVTVAVVTKTLSFAAAFSAFNNDVIWLIVVSFFFAKGFEKTGLGKRVATIFVKCWLHAR